MRPASFAVAIVLLCAGSAAVGAPCYVVFDRNDAIIFRDYKPPFDLSDANSPEREMMRRQGQHLLVADFGDACNPVGYISATTGATAASVDEIVVDVRSVVGSTVAATGATQDTPRPGSKPAPQASAKK